MAGLRQVAFYGDSFVEGIGDPLGIGWVGRVCGALGVTFVNRGVRGETSVEVAARWRASGRSLPLVLSVGANDSCDSGIEGEARVALAESVSVVGGVLSECSALLLPVFCVGPGPVGTEWEDARVLALCDAFAALCAERSVPYLPIARALIASEVWRGEALANDGAHPAAGGYDALAELVLASPLRGWLEDRESDRV